MCPVSYRESGVLGGERERESLFLSGAAIRGAFVKPDQEADPDGRRGGVNVSRSAQPRLDSLAPSSRSSDSCFVGLLGRGEDAVVCSSGRRASKASGFRDWPSWTSEAPPRSQSRLLTRCHASTTGWTVGRRTADDNDGGGPAWGSWSQAH